MVLNDYHVASTPNERYEMKGKNTANFSTWCEVKKEVEKEGEMDLVVCRGD